MEGQELARVKADRDSVMDPVVGRSGIVNSLGGHPPQLVDDHKNEYKIETSI